MTDFDALDFFTDESLLTDPVPYFEHLRGQCPVQPTGHHGVVAVTGYDEAAEVYRDNENFSAINTVFGPFTPFPAPFAGDDITGMLEESRSQLLSSDILATMDPPRHTRERALLMRLMTPKRLRENEDFMWRLADERLDDALSGGRCEFVGDFARPYTLLVIADLLGVPREQHQVFREGFQQAAAGSSQTLVEQNALAWLYGYFAEYVEDRRRHPRDDVLTQLAEAKYPDGSTPEVLAVVHVAVFLFAAGQDTTARLLSSALKYLAEYPELQDTLRADRARIPGFIEECLRMDSPIKSDFRITKRTTALGGVTLPAGTPLAIFNGATNRDPGRFEHPHEFHPGRPNVREHIAFGRGIHSCPGAPLARSEGRVTVDRILLRTRDIRFAEEFHGPAGRRRFEYEPNWLISGLRALHLEFTPVER